MRTIGLIINSIAGMGGRVGLKGTDGKIILDKAIQLGAIKQAPNIAIKALQRLLPMKDELLILTSSFDMGVNQCKQLGFNYEDVYESKNSTSSYDTIITAKIMAERNIDLLIFVGGDGTARDIYKAIDSRVVVLGIPAGVKVHSPVYGNTPELAGELALMYLRDCNIPTKEEEVIDIDEESYRNNQLNTQLYGYLRIPYKKELLQNKKAPTPLGEEASQKAIALDIVDNMLNDVYYLIGPGTTTRSIMNELNLPNSLLGVDIIKDKNLVSLDCNENKILETVGDGKSKLVITPTGGQGYLLGRGNQQISPKVINRIGKDNIIIISSITKIIELNRKPLLVYTGDKETDIYLTSFYKIKIGYGSEIMYRVSGVY